MADDHQAVYRAVVDATEKAIPAALVTVISTAGSMPRHAGSKMLVYEDGRTVGTVGGGAMEARAIKVAQEAMQNGNATTETYTLNSMDAGDPGICGGSATLFIEPLAIPATLLIIGGGHVGQALAELGKWMGYRVVLSDDRIAYCNEDVIPDLDDYIVSAPADLVQKVTITPQTYIAAVTRGLPVDEKLMPTLLETNAGYIGLIGSRRRWAITAKVLRETHGITEAQLGRIHAPIGLELEAESPKEIAISIMAEITMVRRGGTGKPMQWLGRVDDAQ